MTHYCPHALCPTEDKLTALHELIDALNEKVTGLARENAKLSAAVSEFKQPILAHRSEWAGRFGEDGTLFMAHEASCAICQAAKPISREEK